MRPFLLLIVLLLISGCRLIKPCPGINAFDSVRIEKITETKYIQLPGDTVTFWVLCDSVGNANIESTNGKTKAVPTKNENGKTKAVFTTPKDSVPYQASVTNINETKKTVTQADCNCPPKWLWKWFAASLALLVLLIASQIAKYYLKMKL